LSDDVYRYVWEGKLIVNGHNPYTTSPAQMSGSPLADTTIFPKINNAHLPTIYPPLSQAFFVAAYLIGGDSLSGFKLISFLFELLTALSMVLLVRRFKLPAWTFWIYYFSPLVIIEFLFSNHHDILAMPFLVLALVFVQSRKAAAAGLMLALVTMVKLFGLFFVPIALVHLKGTDRYRFLLVFVVSCAVCYLPFLAEAGGDLFGSLWYYLGHWKFNGSVYGPLSKLIGSVPARLFCGTAFGAIALIALRYPRTDWNPFRAMFITFGAYIILAPSMFSWYLVWVIPFLIIYQSLPFLILTGTIFLSYHVLTGVYSRGVWSESVPYATAAYLPFYGLLLYRLVSYIRSKGKTEACALDS
jgi:hypothetical protein